MRKQTELAELEAARTQKELLTIDRPPGRGRGGGRRSGGPRARSWPGSPQAQADAERVKLAGQAEAAITVTKGEAKARVILVNAQAEAEKTKLEGNAEAGIVFTKGEAEAKALALRAEAYRQFNEAAIIQTVLSMLPEIVRAAAEPMAKIGSLTVLSSDGASDVVKNATRTVTEASTVVKGLTGLDVPGAHQQRDRRRGGSGRPGGGEARLGGGGGSRWWGRRRPRPAVRRGAVDRAGARAGRDPPAGGRVGGGAPWPDARLAAAAAAGRRPIGRDRPRRPQRTARPAPPAVADRPRPVDAEAAADAAMDRVDEAVRRAAPSAAGPRRRRSAAPLRPPAEDGRPSADITATRPSTLPPSGSRATCAPCPGIERFGIAPPRRARTSRAATAPDDVADRARAARRSVRRA